MDWGREVVAGPPLSGQDGQGLLKGRHVPSSGYTLNCELEDSMVHLSYVCGENLGWSQDGDLLCNFGQIPSQPLYGYGRDSAVPIGHTQCLARAQHPLYAALGRELVEQD